MLAGLLLPALGGSIVADYLHFLQQGSTQTITLEIERGASLAQIAKKLEQNHVISSALRFTLLARWQRLHISSNGVQLAPGIQAGEYEFPAGELPQQVLLRLSTGNQVVHRLSIPEGLTVQDILQRLQSQGWHNPEKVANDPEWLKKMALATPSLEGWLFPSTYHYHRHDSTAEILSRMVKQTQQVLDELWQTAQQEGAQRSTRAVDLSPVETLILASIIEKETGQASERARVSAVFHNRLRKKMRLQSDPTVIYGLQKGLAGHSFDGNLTRQHLREATPYNTYTQYGLPPTPICNPGKASIRAALFPEESDDLYFVARGEGFHVFAKTLPEHEANVDRYQRHLPPPKKR
ncbi:endolytic transglycosylase MltG [Candidatus Magnetaquicoccus inordinatus]|uniref:endolytic transglycosylase MltG n=1 Tax=Candidatus Magnetaquicoccus inordinatus TaxID=2496818 RepID=UPI00187D3DF7|nr:endolytic transglycosylase MltG [Candidatus Magnetaquicoccus inordinatus]